MSLMNHGQYKLFVIFPVAEVASILVRNVNYEGPALRKQVSKAQQLQQELSRRELDCQSGAADMKKGYYAACKQYGIKVCWLTWLQHFGHVMEFIEIPILTQSLSVFQGENVARELQALVKDLPVVLEETGKKAACLEEAIEFYTAFTNLVCGW